MENCQDFLQIVKWLSLIFKYGDEPFIALFDTHSNVFAMIFFTFQEALLK